jgi:hypothetical protein
MSATWTLDECQAWKQRQSVVEQTRGIVLAFTAAVNAALDGTTAPPVVADDIFCVDTAVLATCGSIHLSMSVRSSAEPLMLSVFGHGAPVTVGNDTLWFVLDGDSAVLLTTTPPETSAGSDTALTVAAVPLPMVTSVPVIIGIAIAVLVVAAIVIALFVWFCCSGGCRRGAKKGTEARKVRPVELTGKHAAASSKQQSMLLYINHKTADPGAATGVTEANLTPTGLSTGDQLERLKQFKRFRKITTALAVASRLTQTGAAARVDDSPAAGQREQTKRAAVKTAAAKKIKAAGASSAVTARDVPGADEAAGLADSSAADELKRKRRVSKFRKAATREKKRQSKNTTRSSERGAAAVATAGISGPGSPSRSSVATTTEASSRQDLPAGSMTDDATITVEEQNEQVKRLHRFRKLRRRVSKMSPQGSSAGAPLPSAGGAGGRP